MHLKVFVKLKKTLKTLSAGQKNPIKPKKPQKTQKTQKNPLGWFFFFKNPVFFQPCTEGQQLKDLPLLIRIKRKILTGRT
jgi:hypothetical protein